MVTGFARPKSRTVPAIVRRDLEPIRRCETRLDVSSRSGRGRGKTGRIGSAGKADPVYRVDSGELVVHTYRSFRVVVFRGVDAET